MQLGVLNRRSFLRDALGGFTTFALANQFGDLFAADADTAGRAVIVLWMEGGPSHIDTFDPKPGRNAGGEFKAIKTAITGVSFSEHLPHLAGIANDLTVVRSMQTRQSNHTPATYLMHTGFMPDASVTHPSMGSVISMEVSKGALLPTNVVLGQMDMTSPLGRGPGFLSQSYAPIAITDPTNPGEMLAVLEPDVIRRIQLAKLLDQEFLSTHEGLDIVKRNRFIQLAERLRGTSFEDALNFSNESEETIGMYLGGNSNVPLDVPGNRASASSFGYGCLLARRLVERGVRFVEVGLGGWDSHQDNFATVRSLCKVLDPAFSGLVRDLKQRGLLKSTLVVCMGEFGRTPDITGAKGRDHWAEAFSVVLAGGTTVGGTLIGETDADGGGVKKSPFTVPELIAHVYRFMGIDPKKRFELPDARVVSYTRI